MAERSANVSAGLSSDVETKHKILLKIPIHLATPQDPPRSNQDEDEEEEDKLEWADEFGEDEQGDWTMERYSSPGGNRDTDTQVQMSGRTGERDTRSMCHTLCQFLSSITDRDLNSRLAEASHIT